MINLNQLRAFYQAAKYGNLSIAAQALFVSQPAVTAQIKLFEESCGLKLFKSLENLGTKQMRFQGMGALMAKMIAKER